MGSRAADSGGSLASSQLGGRSAIVTINEEGTIQSVDRGCCEMFGYEMHNLPGQSVKVLIPAPYKEQHDSYMAEYHRTGVAKIIGKKRTVEGLHRSGTVFPLRLAVNEVNTGRGRIYIGMLEAMPHHVAEFLTDVSGTVLESSGGVEDIWGYSPSEVKGMLLETLLPIEGKSFADVFSTYLSYGGGAVVGCVRNARACLSNGTYITVCLSVNQETFAPVAQCPASVCPPSSLSKREDAESSRALQRFRARVERVDLDREAVFTLSTDGRVLSANSAFLLPLMGYTGEELLDKNISLVLPHLEGSLLPRRLKRKKSTGSSLLRKENVDFGEREGEKRKNGRQGGQHLNNRKEADMDRDYSVGGRRGRQGTRQAPERKKRKLGGDDGNKSADTEARKQESNADVSGDPAKKEATTIDGLSERDQRASAREGARESGEGQEREKQTYAQSLEEDAEANTKTVTVRTEESTAKEEKKECQENAENAGEEEEREEEEREEEKKEEEEREEEEREEEEREEELGVDDDYEVDVEGGTKRSLWLSGSLGDSSVGLPVSRTLCLHKDGTSFFVEVRLTRFLGANSSERLSVMVRRAEDEAHAPQAALQERTPIGLDFVMGPLRIGAGSFGKVRQGWRTSTNEPVAVKVIEKTVIDAAELQRARREISILRSLEHESICRLYDVVETKENIFIVMELCENGELFQYVTSRGRLEEEEARAFFRQIVEAVHYCHSKNIIHRDIKHKNILLDKSSRIKLIDFGLSNYALKDGLRSTFCGTPAYSAPEMILAQKYSGPEVDIWSVGVVLYSMLTGEFPFKTVSHIIEGAYAMPDYLSKECQDVICLMLVVDGKERVTAEELLLHPFVAGAHAAGSEGASS